MYRKMEDNMYRKNRLAAYIMALAVITALLSLSVIVYADAIDDLKRESQSWIRETKNIYRLDFQAMGQIWEAYCGSDWEPNEEPDKDFAREQSNNIRDTQVRLIEPQLRVYEDLKRKAEDLKKDKTEATAKEILESMKTEADRIEKLKNIGAWRGANHPLIQFAIEYGKEQHRNMESSSSYACDVKDREYSGAAGRPDCVSASMCTVFEFKPDNQRAKNKGEEQLDRYVPAVQQYYQEKIDQRTLPDSDKGGQDIITKITARCMSGSRVTFKREVKTYRMCEKRYEGIE